MSERPRHRFFHGRRVTVEDPAGWRDVRLMNPDRVSGVELAAWKRVVSGWDAPQPFEQVPDGTGYA